MPGPFRGTGSTLAGRAVSGTALPATRHRTASSRWYRPALERRGSSADPPTGGSTSGTDPQTRTGARDERVRSATPPRWHARAATGSYPGDAPDDPPAARRHHPVIRRRADGRGRRLPHDRPTVGTSARGNRAAPDAP